MKTLKTLPCLVALLAAVQAAWDAPAADPAPAPGVLVVVDGGGKEQKLKAWKFVAGTRRLGWLAPAAPPKSEPGQAPAGPEALEFRDDNSTTFVDGILTLVLLDHLRALEYDADKETVTARVSLGEKAEADEALTGTTKFKGINQVTVEAEIDKGELVGAEIRFPGGTPKGVRAFRFPAPKPAPAVAGRAAAVSVAEAKDKTGVQKVVDLQPLYRTADGGERLLPTLLFKKTLKLDVAKVQKLTAGEGRSPDGSEWTVTLKDGEEHTLTLLKAPTIDDQPMALVGFVGKVRGGYKLFPVHTVAAVEFDAEKGGVKP
jgi:hypothetical protein